MGTIVFAGTAVTRPGSVGTLYRAQGSGSFAPVAGIPLDTGVQAITPHPAKPGVIYASTHCGLFESTDNGASFRKLPVPSAEGEQFWSVAIHPNDPETMLAGCGPIGVYKTTDGGASWRRVGSSGPMAERMDMTEGKFFKHSRIMALAYDPADPAMVYGAVETSGFIVSEDGGETWTNRSEGLVALVDADPALKSQINVPDDYEGILDAHCVRVSPDRPGTCFYACRMGLFSTPDAGRTWRNHDIRRFAEFSYTRDMRIAAQDPQTMYLALSIASRSDSGALYRSDDLGESLYRCDQPVTAVSTIMGMGAGATDSAKVVYVTRGGQVHFSDDGAKGWQAGQLPPEAGDAYCAAIV
ncbi:hypothetical protein H7F51_07195 [Novosphingobium flavum]|uniref:Sortilin N-terminal domain-containing protein n=1 Tax=Novosphingobium flavum TaxID=1778672 RepID=A0A7X1FQU9_9SPHN|nr:hypothetical protein [Novosphingobium flavum]MBC2665300.1 hypothetical protein [Novosphingobium flavum]